MSLEHARTFRMIKVNNIGLVFMRDIGQGCLFYKKLVSGPILSVASLSLQSLLAGTLEIYIYFVFCKNHRKRLKPK